MRGSRLELTIETLEAGQQPAHVDDRIDTISRAAAMRRDTTRLDLDPRETLVADADLQVRRLGDDRGVCGPRRHERVGADARVFFVDDRRDDEASPAEPARENYPRRVDHCRDAALHVLRSATVDPPGAFGRIERRSHPFDADRIRVPAEHQRTSGQPALEDADDVRTAGRGFLQVHVEPKTPHVRGYGFRNLPFTPSPRHQRRIDRVDADEIAQKRNARIVRHGRLYYALMDLTGRVAAITGASSGIGLACARHLAQQGVGVVLGARRADRLEAVAREIRDAGGRAEAVVMDVTIEDDVARLVATAQDRLGRLDLMVCNAGFGYYGTIEETPPDIMRRMMEVNFTGTYLGARAARPVFRRQGHGHLIIVSSIVGQRGIPQMSGYSATKAAQVGFAESLRAELAGTDVHVTVVYPVSTDTEFKSAMQRDYGHTVSGLGPKQSADDVARAVVACARRPRAEVYPHAVSRGLAVLNAIAPGFTDKVVRKYARRRETT
jgi:short-subunit dehydrogenase